MITDPDPTAGTMLGEEARAALIKAGLPSSIERMSDGYLSVCQRSEEEAADLALAVLAPHVAALVAQARADGEQAARRECATELKALIKGGSYVEQLWNAVEEWEAT